MQRYFIDKKFNKIEFTDDQIYHISKVMRMKLNDSIEVVFDGHCFVCKITSFNPLLVEITNEINLSPELNVDITLLYCLPKGDKLDLVIQKATEIGVNKIVLVQSSRCVTKYKKDDFKKKLERFNKIAIEASEQSHRFNVPEIKDIINFNEIKNYSFDYSFIAYENEKKLSLNEVKNINKNQSIGIIIGSEGGFSTEEIQYANECGYTSISLGKRILRSETACIYALSIISFLTEDI